MTAGEMRSAAKNLVAEAADYSDYSSPSTRRANLLAEAQVYATLAVSKELAQLGAWFHDKP